VRNATLSAFLFVLLLGLIAQALLTTLGLWPEQWEAALRALHFAELGINVLAIIQVNPRGAREAAVVVCPTLLSTASLRLVRLLEVAGDSAAMLVAPALASVASACLLMSARRQ
jgi:hypothetical protein